MVNKLSHWCNLPKYLKYDTLDYKLFLNKEKNQQISALKFEHSRYRYTELCVLRILIHSKKDHTHSALFTWFTALKN